MYAEVLLLSIHMLMQLALSFSPFQPLSDTQQACQNNGNTSSPSFSPLAIVPIIRFASLILLHFLLCLVAVIIP